MYLSMAKNMFVTDRNTSAAATRGVVFMLKTSLK